MSIFLTLDGIFLTLDASDLFLGFSFFVFFCKKYLQGDLWLFSTSVPLEVAKATKP